LDIFAGRIRAVASEALRRNKRWSTSKICAPYNAARNDPAVAFSIMEPHCRNAKASQRTGGHAGLEFQGVLYGVGMALLAF